MRRERENLTLSFAEADADRIRAAVAVNRDLRDGILHTLSCVVRAQCTACIGFGAVIHFSCKILRIVKAINAALPCDDNLCS